MPRSRAPPPSSSRRRRGDEGGTAAHAGGAGARGRCALFWQLVAIVSALALLTVLGAGILSVRDGSFSRKKKELRRSKGGGARGGAGGSGGGSTRGACA